MIVVLPEEAVPHNTILTGFLKNKFFIIPKNEPIRNIIFLK